MEVPPRGIYLGSCLNFSGMSTSHSKPQTSTPLHHLLESPLEREKKISKCSCFISKRYLEGGWCPALTATAARHGESPVSLPFAICAAWIPIVPFSPCGRMSQPSGNRLFWAEEWWAFGPPLMEAVLPRGYWNTLQQREKVCKTQHVVLWAHS